MQNFGIYRANIKGYTMGYICQKLRDIVNKNLGIYCQKLSDIWG